MEIISFKVKGKLAHFRKYYANNTAFSFTIPPRTTLMGMVAAIMGWPKDSYYEILSSENIRFGVRVMSPLKKSFHRLNFLSIKSVGDLAKNWSSDFRGEQGRVQTPFEVVSGWNIGQNEVVYQIFISCRENGQNTFSELRKHLISKTPVYNISLGTANFTASIFDVCMLTTDEIEEKETDDFIYMHTALPTEMVKELRFDKEEFGDYNFVEEDLMPGDFKEKDNREVRKMNRLLFSTSSNPLRVKLKGPYYCIRYTDEVINIQFMDG
jgi:CRISPR-associated protein Cas5h